MLRTVGNITGPLDHNKKNLWTAYTLTKKTKKSKDGLAKAQGLKIDLCSNTVYSTNDRSKPCELKKFLLDAKRKTNKNLKKKLKSVLFLPHPYLSLCPTAVGGVYTFKGF